MFRARVPPRRADGFRRTLALLLVVALASGCSSMRALQGTPVEATADLPQDETVQVLLTNGDRVELQFVRVLGDSLQGIGRRTRGDAPDQEAGETRSVKYALADIQELRAMQPDTGRTVRSVLGGILVVGVVLLIVAGSIVGEY